MSVLKRRLESLTDEMTKQSCYQKYQELLKKIQEDGETYHRLNEYRRRNVALHWEQGGLREEAVLKQEYHDLLHDRQIQEFLFWEQETLQMMQMIHQQVNDALSLDDSFLSEGM